MERFCGLLTRRKCLDHTLQAETKLSKCLSTTDLIFLGIGSTMGSGIYVVIGEVAHLMAGPSVFLSLIIAGIASIFAGLCYAELGARVPVAGSAYVYSYVAVGELWAFVIGWNLILEYVIGCAAIATATSAYIDTICGNAISTFMLDHFPMNVPTLAPYPDFLAFAFTLVLTIVLCFGMRESSLMNNILTIINLTVVLFAVGCGLYWVDGSNWSIPASQVPAGFGKGGFFPYGLRGTMAGAATCFYAYVGFDIIATAGEETVTPIKSIPRAIVGCLVVCSMAYIVSAVVLSLMVPYYTMDPSAALPVAFKQLGWPVATYIISVGAICALTACLLVSCAAMPRIIYSMAKDGLLFSFLARVNDRFKTPIYATVISGLLTGVLAMLIQLEELIEMLSIGTLLAYTLVAICVLLLRYEPDWKAFHSNPSIEFATAGWRQSLTDVFTPAEGSPTLTTFRRIRICLGLLVLFTIWSGLVLVFLTDWLEGGTWWAILLLVLPVILIIFTVGIMWRQPMNSSIPTFQVPWVPLVPALSIFANVYLMLNLSLITWLRFIIWMTAGFLIYFLYGIRHNALHIRSVTYTEIAGSNGALPPPSYSGDTAPRDVTGDVTAALTDHELVGQSDKINLVAAAANVEETSH